jgi:hypothetical protein
MGEVKELVLKHLRREVRLTGQHDSLLNNAQVIVDLEDVGGKVIASLAPGDVYQPRKPVTVYFTSDANLGFRAYINGEPPEGYPRRMDVIPAKTLMHAL